MQRSPQDERVNHFVQCRCREREDDMRRYGVHICRDGNRIAPEDYYADPPAMQSGKQGG